MPANLRGPTPRNNAAAIVAMKHAVPEAVSQFSSKSAPYGVFAGTTGGTWVIMLCSPGTLIRFNRATGVGRGVRSARNESGRKPSDHVLILALMFGSPTVNTQITSSRYGSHAMKT